MLENMDGFPFLRQNKIKGIQEVAPERINVASVKNDHESLFPVAVITPNSH